MAELLAKALAEVDSAEALTGKLKVELFKMLRNPRMMIAGEVDFPFEKRII